MRVTDHMIFDSARRAVQDARARLLPAQEQASTGRRVVAPSDDPAAARRILQIDAMLARAQSHRANYQRGIGALLAADQALGEAGGVLARARSLAVAAASDSLSAADRRAAAAEAEGLFAEMRSLANTRFDGEYLFGGNAIDTPPMADDGGFSGTDDERAAEMAPGVRVPVRVSGARAFATAGAEAAAALRGLGDALSAGDGAAVRGAMAAIQAAFAQVQDARVRAGAYAARAESASALADRADEALRTERAARGDADAYRALSALVEDQRALEAALAIAARVTGRSLLDELR